MYLGKYLSPSSLRLNELLLSGQAYGTLGISRTSRGNSTRLPCISLLCIRAHAFIFIFIRGCHGLALVGRWDGPAHEFFKSWAAARPGPSNCQRMGRGPAQPIAFLKFTARARPGPAHDIGGEAHETRALYGLARQFCGQARGFDGPGHGALHVLSRTQR